MEGDIGGVHWTALRELLPLYQAITTVAIGDGRSTSFWYDVWCGDESFSERFQALLSHCTSDKQTVSDVVGCGLQPWLVNRLTPEATDELTLLGGILSAVTLAHHDDKRLSPFSGVDGNLQTSALYALIKSMHNPSGSVTTNFWKSCAPPRVQFFAWLLQNDRIQCKVNLHRRHILGDDTCDLCGTEPETASHLLFHCEFASSFWRSLGYELAPELTVADAHRMPRPESVPANHFDTFTLLCCWQLWKRRNGFVFRGETMGLRQTLHACRSAART